MFCRADGPPRGADSPPRSAELGEEEKRECDWVGLKSWLVTVGKFGTHVYFVSMQFIRDVSTGTLLVVDKELDWRRC